MENCYNCGKESVGGYSVANIYYYKCSTCDDGRVALCWNCWGYHPLDKTPNKKSKCEAMCIVCRRDSKIKTILNEEL